MMANTMFEDMPEDTFDEEKLDPNLDPRLKKGLLKARRSWEQREARRRQQAAEAETSPQPVPPVEPVRVRHFPTWHDEKHAGPDICLRSALFGVIRPGRRRWLKRETLATVDGYVVMWAGEMLDQGDLDIWLHFLYLLRGQPIGSEVYFSPRRVLRELGRNTGKSDRAWLFRGLDRLAKGVATLASSRFQVTSSLLGWGMNEQTERYFVSSHEKLVPLFQHDTYTLLDFQQRLSVSSQLGRWLHEFYSTHAVPYAYKVETLRDLCGSECQRLRDFRKELRHALDDLVTSGLLMSWEIDTGDLVQVKKRPSPSQARHIIRHLD